MLQKVIDKNIELYINYIYIERVVPLPIVKLQKNSSVPNFQLHLQ